MPANPVVRIKASMAVCLESAGMHHSMIPRVSLPDRVVRPVLAVHPLMVIVSPTVRVNLPVILTPILIPTQCLTVPVVGGMKVFLSLYPILMEPVMVFQKAGERLKAHPSAAVKD